MAYTVSTTYNSTPENAYGDAITALWQGFPFIAGNSAEISNMCSYQAVVAFYLDTQEETTDRRRLLKSYMYACDYDTSALSWVNRIDISFPTNSSIPSIADKLNILYDIAPVRLFSSNENIDADMNNLYKNANMNGFMQTVSELTYLCDTVAVGVSKVAGELRKFYLTPDLYRVKTNPDDSDIIDAIYYVNIDIENSLLESHTWTNETHKIEYLGINGMKNNTPDTIIDNELGRIPFVFSQSKTKPANGRFTGGRISLIDKQLEINQTVLMARNGSTYDGSPFYLGINLGGVVDMKPGSVKFVDDLTDEMQTPSLEITTPENMYADQMARADELTRRLEVSAGVPLSMVSIDTAVIESGVAKAIDLQPLYLTRQQQIPFYEKFERELYQLILDVMGFEYPTDEFSITYTAPTIVIDPIIEKEIDDKLLKDGLISLSSYTAKYGNGLSEDEDEIIGVITARKELLKGIGLIVEESEVVNELTADNINNE